LNFILKPFKETIYEKKRIGGKLFGSEKTYILSKKNKKALKHIKFSELKYIFN